MLLERKYINILKSVVSREISAKYKGTVFGAVWNIINPLFMLLIYSTVFLHVFKARWEIGNNEYADYALMLFIGIITHIFMSEVLTGATAVIRNNSHIVKKIVFPLEILPVTVVLVAALNFMIGIVLTLIYSISMGYINAPLNLLFIPIIIGVYVTTLLALSYFFSSISVYVRDVQQVIPVVSLVLLFTSTVFFSIRTAPDSLGAILYINPISIIADALRESIYTESVSWHRLLSLFLISSVMLVFFYKIYNKLKLGFTDVL